jgi:hypothetical protein
MKYKIDRCHKLNIQIDQAESGLALLIDYTSDIGQLQDHDFSAACVQ